MKPRSASVLQLTIVDIAFGGKGVARHEGKVYFVPWTLPGEVVTVRVLREKKNFAEAQVLSVDAPSPDRVEPPCPYFGRCGGCAYQHIAAPRQLEIKAQQVEQTLRRVGRLAEVPMEPLISSPQMYGYRNRIRVHVEGGRAGFYAQGSHSLVDVEQCAIARAEVNQSLRRLRAAALQDGDYALRAPGGGGPFFEQTNEAVARALVELAERKVLRGQRLLVDAFCGAGLFAKHLAPLFEKVIGIEENAHAIQSAQSTATSRESYFCGDVGEHLGEILGADDPDRTTVVLDPPAVGLTPAVIDALLAGRPREIVYVSCNPATLARDLAAICGGYRLESVTPLDMFPQTADIEVLAHLRRVVV
jgi:tRNA/tmRNA/rRNA uracil-C5-methylase (TrmA/RlmC/RlmD family)